MYKLTNTVYKPGYAVINRIAINPNKPVPWGVIKEEDGNFVVKDKLVSAELIFSFQDDAGIVQSFDGYPIIKRTMRNERLTKGRREKVIQMVAILAEKSEYYRPVEWIQEAVKIVGI